MKNQVLLLFISACLFSGCSSGESEKADNWKTLPSGAGVEMLAYTAELVKISPRDSDTVNAGKASQWIAQEIRRIGMTPKADTWSENTAFGKKTFSNIYVDYAGKTDNIILFGSHYDTKAGLGDTFQGANDGGSSTGVLLGLIEHFARTQPKFHHTIRFAFFDGEECFGPSYREDDGLHGSRRMATQFVRGRLKTPLSAVIVLDMVGDKQQVIQIPRNVTPELAKIALEVSRDMPGASRVILAQSAIIDDHWPFIEKGFPAVNLIDFEYGSEKGRHDYWHTSHDTVDKLSPDSLRKVGMLAIGVLARLEENAKADTELGAR